MTKLEDKIKKSIKGKKTKSKEYFVARNIAKDIIVGILWFICICVLGAQIYLLQNFPWHAFSLPRFILTGFIGLPWEITFISVACIIGLYYLTKNISTFYRNTNILVLALAISLFTGYFIAESSGLNDYLATTRPIKPIYQQQGRLIAPKRFPVVMGELVSIKNDTVVVQDASKEKWNVKISDNTRIIKPLKVGQRVGVIGKKDGNIIEAQEIRSSMERRGFQKKTSLTPRVMY